MTLRTKGGPSQCFNCGTISFGVVEWNKHSRKCWQKPEHGGKKKKPLVAVVEPEIKVENVEVEMEPPANFEIPTDLPPIKIEPVEMDEEPEQNWAATKLINLWEMARRISENLLPVGLTASLYQELCRDVAELSKHQMVATLLEKYQMFHIQDLVFADRDRYELFLVSIKDRTIRERAAGIRQLCRL